MLDWKLTGPWSLRLTLTLLIMLHCVASRSLNELEEFSGHQHLNENEDDTRSYEYSPYYSQDWVYVPSKYVPPVFQASYYIPSMYTSEYFQSSEYTPSVYIEPPTPPPKHTPATTASPNITVESKPKPSKGKKHSSLRKHLKSTGNLLQSHPLTAPVTKTLIPGSIKTSATSSGKAKKVVLANPHQVTLPYTTTSTIPIYGTVLNSFGTMLGK